MSRDRIDRSSGPNPTDLLTRSRIEISATLGRILREGPPLIAYLENGEQLIVTQLRHVDPDEGYIVVDYGLSRYSNPLVLQRKSITFHCDVGLQHVQFPAALPRETVHDGIAAIRLDFPEYLMRYRHRRQPRFRIPPELQLKCTVECPGAISFEMLVQDISRGGIGMVTHDLDIRLEPGTVLRGCLIRHPLHAAVHADLEIRHSTLVRFPDGSAKIRSGCRFIGKDDEIAKLAGMFSVNLDSRP